jgi:DNA adenine methylase
MKYMGSKRRIAKYIAPIIQAHIDSGQYKTYIEPFVGGANMIEHIKCETRIGSDINGDLIALLLALQDGWIPPDYVTREKYKHVRMNLEDYLPSFRGWVSICCSYNGKSFGGFAGKITTKINTERNYQTEAKKNVLEQAKSLQDIEFRYHSYKNWAPENCVVYCDPPYQKTTNYSTGGFSHKEFWLWCRKYSRPEYNNCILVSEYEAPEMFAKCIWQKEINSSLTQDTGSKKAIEKLFWVRD